MRLFYFCILLCSVQACSLLKAGPADDAGFLPDSALLSEMRSRSPFHAEYIPNKKKLDELHRTRTKVFISPVLTEFAEAKIRNKSLPDFVIEQRIEDLRELAAYFENKLKMTFTEFTPEKISVVPFKNSFTVTSSPEPDSLVWEVAIIELSPNIPELAVAATAASFFVPGTGNLKALGTGSIAIEVIVRDGETGDIVAEFRDRESDKSAPVSIRDYQMYAHSQTAMDDWAEQFVELSVTPCSHQVEDSLPFTINPF